jgi:hypothetical protein
MAVTQSRHNDAEIGSKGVTQTAEQINKPHRHPRGRARTSARAIKLKQRQADVLTYRMQGHSYAAIGKQLGISPDTAWRDAVAAISRIVPTESAQQVLKMELARLDTLEAGLFSNAAEGDISAVDACLRIQNQRCRLMGLFPDQRNGGVHVNIGGPVIESAEDSGIQIEFVKATKWGDPAAAAKVIQGLPEPMLTSKLKPL